MDYHKLPTSLTTFTSSPLILVITSILGLALATTIIMGLFGRKNHMPVEGKVRIISPLP